MSFGGDLPIYASSIVGYAMWHLLRGESVDDVTARIDADYRFAGIDPGVIRASVEQAVVNAAATQRAEVANLDTTLAETFFRFVPTGETVGVRAIMTLQFPDGHSETISVVVNASETATLAEALDAATAFVDSGGLSTRTGRAYIGTVIASSVAQVFAGGYANPAITI